jgi:hypothetical protein
MYMAPRQHAPRQCRLADGPEKITPRVITLSGLTEDTPAHDGRTETGATASVDLPAHLLPSIT